MARWEEFRKCPGCGYDFATGEGRKEEPRSHVENMRRWRERLSRSG